MKILSENDKKRINFYLGDLDNNIKFNDIYENVENIEYSSLKRTNLFKFSSIEDLKIKINNMECNNHKIFYLKSLYKILIKYKIYEKYKFFIKTGDIDIIGNNINIPCFTKAITNERNLNNSVILRCLNFERHWGNYYKKPKDIKFNKKKDKVIWRGTTTGSEDRDGNRFILVKKWFNKNKNINVGFSFICEEKDSYKKYVKDNKKITDLLKYKYIISVEGNDKDSGLNWKLNSNSLVLMPRPRVSSWLMETTLIPNYHYVLLKDDFSDLKIKYKWCKKNQKKCKEIIKNANNYMKQFKNEEHEEFLEKYVIKKYLEHYN